MTELFQRSCEFDLSARAAGMDDNVVPAVISTDAPVAMAMGGKRVLEILDHKPEAVDLSRFPLPLVEDHDNARTAIGVAESPSLEGGKLRVMMRFGSQARAREILADVKAGIIRNLSVSYSRQNTVRESDDTVRTVKWMPQHVSPVGTPADAGAGFFRSQPTKEVPMSDPIVPEPVDPAIALNAARAEAKEVAGIARSLDLPADDFVGLPKADATAAMLKAVAARKAAALPEPKQIAATITVDHADKQVSAIVNAIGARANVNKVEANNPYAGRSLTDIAIKYAKNVGIRAADEWTRKDAAHFILGENSMVSGMRDAANITTGNFTGFVMLDAITKITAKGMENVPKGLVSGSGAPIYDTQTVADFKSFRVGGLGTGNFSETAENVAFPELTKTEAVYSDTAKMWGGTLSLTIQALVSDDTGAFDRSLRMAPSIAQKTIEKRIIQKLLMGTSSSTGTSTWTSNTTSGCTPVYTTADTLAAARKNLGIGNAALQLKVGMDGQATGNAAKFIVCGPTAAGYFRGLLNIAPGQTVSNSGDFELVVSHFLENTALTGYSTTTYYLVCDPMLVTGLILSKVSGYENIQVQEYDAGAVGARKWKMWLPFEADLFYAANTAGTNTVFGVQQATT